MSRTSPLLAGAAGAAVISTSAVLIKLSELPATTVAALRTGYAVPVLALLGFAVRYRRGGRTRGRMGARVSAGLLFGGCVLFQNLAIELIGAGVATVVCNLQVLVVAAGGWWLFAEKPPRRLLMALPAALLGVVMVAGVGGQSFGTQAALGVLAGLANSLCYGAFLLVLRRIQGRADGGTVTLLRDVAAVACVVSLLAVAVTGDGGLAPVWPGHGWALLLALGPQVLGWLLITGALPRLPVAVSGLLLLLQPMIAMGLSMAVLGEDPSAVQLAGCVLLLAAIGCGSSRRDRAQPESADTPTPHPSRAEPELADTAAPDPSRAALEPSAPPPPRSSVAPAPTPTTTPPPRPTGPVVGDTTARA